MIVSREVRVGCGFWGEGVYSDVEMYVNKSVLKVEWFRMNDLRYYGKRSGIFLGWSIDLVGLLWW